MKKISSVIMKNMQEFTNSSPKIDLKNIYQAAVTADNINGFNTSKII